MSFCNPLTIIFPHQLFYPNPSLRKERMVCLFEADRYFTDFQFHKLKLCLHRASMKAYQEKLQEEGYHVDYVQNSEIKSIKDFFSEYLVPQRITTLYFVDVVDNKLSKQLKEQAEANSITLHEEESPSFLNTKKSLEGFSRGKKRFLMASFYKAERIRLNILLDDGNPIGGKWSYDEENRKKLPRNLTPPRTPSYGENKWVLEAKEYIKKNFKSNPGDCTTFFYPITHDEAERWFADFLQNRFDLFGDFEDAIHKDELILFHSLISPLLNIGLLTPEGVLKKTLNFTKKQPPPLNSLEGFVRQIIGWREFIRAIYLMIGEEQRESNYFKNERKLPLAFYSATTGIEPVDSTIKKVMENAYCHHIERLMVLGNFMLLCEISPVEVYRWFMELFIDAYDWVMVPNVFGMSQFADGGKMSTKPYFSSSNYLLKTSNFTKGSWTTTFDALFWNFIDQKKDLLEYNQRMSFILNIFKKLPKEKLAHYKAVAKNYLENSLK